MADDETAREKVPVTFAKSAVDDVAGLTDPAAAENDQGEAEARKRRIAAFRRRTGQVSLVRRSRAGC